MRSLLFIFLLSFTTLFIGCSGDNNSSNNNGNSFTNSMDYEFTITINGEVHKVKGNTTNGIPKGSVVNTAHYINNECEVLNSTQKVVMLKINDVTVPNYISGQNLVCEILFPNLLLGTNQAQIIFTGTYFDSVCANIGAYNPGSGLGFRDFQTVSGVYNSSFHNILPFNITDLGTTSTFPSSPYNFGETLKGNYSGTIYFKSSSNNYSIPVQLSIDFKALRTY